MRTSTIWVWHLATPSLLKDCRKGDGIMATDFLYCKFNDRGRKQFDSIERGELESKFADYVKVGLPAHKAALDGNIECLKDLFSAYWDDGVPSRDVNGATPLHLAVRNSRMDAVKWLLRYTTLSPLDEAKYGETPVHVAAAQGNLECLKVLLSAENKAEINALATAVDKSEFTVLYLAILKQCNDCAKYLISQLGAKGVGQFNESGVTASHIAASAGNVDVLKLISQKFKKYICLPAADGTTPVYHAAQQGQLDALKFLVEKCKCKLTVASDDGAKPIHAAAQCGHTHIIQYIVKQQGNKAVFDQGTDKATPLHYAACNGHVETAEWLLKSDVSGRLIIAKDKNGDTPAHDAAENGQTEMLKFLLEAGADLYIINDEGNTPYAVALKGDNPDTANFVMTEAAKAPKPNQQCPQVTIFDLQGDVAVVDVNPPSEQPDLGGGGGGMDEPETSLISKPEKASKKGKGSKKKKKRKDEGTEPTSDGKQNPEKDGNDDGPLEFNEDDIELFENSKVDEDESIVVRYTSKPPPPVLVTADYSTVNEVAKTEEKKQRKKGRKMPKSIQNALKSGKKKSSDSSNTKKSGKSSFSGLGNIGFKSRSQANPLLNVRIPPTPPPTPATGASIAPSDEAPQQAATDLEESEIVLQAENESSDVLPKRKSENAKLLDDTLKHLSSENSPPDEPDAGPKVAQGSQSAGYAGAKQKFEKFGPTVKSHRPVFGEAKNKVELQSENLSEAKHAFVKLRPTTSGKVGSLASSFTKTSESSEAVEAKRLPFANLKPTTLTKFGATPNAFKSSTPSQSSTAAKEALAKLKPAAATGSSGAAPSANTAATIHAAATAKKIPTIASANKSDTPSESSMAAKQALAKLKARAPPASASASPPTSKPDEREMEKSNGAQEEDSEVKNKFVQLKKVARNEDPGSSKETELSKIQLKKSTRTTPPRARAVYSKPGTEKASGASNELLNLMKGLSAK